MELKKETIFKMHEIMIYCMWVNEYNFLPLFFVWLEWFFFLTIENYLLGSIKDSCVSFVGEKENLNGCMEDMR